MWIWWYCSMVSLLLHLLLIRLLYHFVFWRKTQWNYYFESNFKCKNVKVLKSDKIDIMIHITWAHHFRLRHFSFFRSVSVDSFDWWFSKKPKTDKTILLSYIYANIELFSFFLSFNYLRLFILSYSVYLYIYQKCSQMTFHTHIHSKPFILNIKEMY